MTLSGFLSRTQNGILNIVRRLIGITAELAVIAAEGAVLTRVGTGAWVTAIPGLVDAAIIGSEIWTASAGDDSARRFDPDGVRIGDIPLPGIIATGRWRTSSFVRAAVWQGEAPWAVREDGPVALTAAEIAAPVSDGRWLTWRSGHASLWRSTSELWRASLGEAMSLLDVAALLDGRLIAFHLRERTGGGERLLVLGARDGSVSCNLRLSGVRTLRFAPRRGTALLHVGEHIIAIDAEGVAIIDQHVAHERILFERITERLTSGRLESQRLLEPLLVELSASGRQTLLAHAADLDRMGFEIEDFGGESLRLSACPALLPRDEWQRAVRALAEDLDGLDQGAAVTDALKRIAATMACHAAVKANYPLTAEKMVHILDGLRRTAYSTICPHGRPVMLRLTRRELEKRFERI